MSEVHNEATPLLTRGICKTDWTKPKFVNKPYVERRRAPELPMFVQTTRGHGKVRYGELWNLWDNIQNDLFRTSVSSRNGNLTAMFATLSLGDHRNNNTTRENADVSVCDIFNDEQTLKKQQLDALLQTYQQLQGLCSNQSKKWLSAEQNSFTESRMYATTANADETEKLTQKIETIGEVPLVEAEPDIIKPPKTTGPTNMNMTELKYEESALLSDFQVHDDFAPNEPIRFHCKEKRIDNIEEPLRSLPTYSTHTKNYFENTDASQKPNFYDLSSIHSALPEIKFDDNACLTESLRRVPQRNPILRCQDIRFQLSDNIGDQGKNPFYHPNQQPQWEPYPVQPQHHSRPSYPVQPIQPRSMPRKAEPITPDSRPRYYRASKVNPVTLALHLGPLVSCFRSAAILFPLITCTQLDADSREKLVNPLAELADLVIQEVITLSKALAAVFKETSDEETDQPVDFALTQVQE